MSLCESWNFLIMARQASLRPGSVQNHVRKLSSILAARRKAGAIRGTLVAAWALLTPAPAIIPPAIALPPILMNSRRLMDFGVLLGVLFSCSDMVISSFLRVILGRLV